MTNEGVHVPRKRSLSRTDAGAARGACRRDRHPGESDVDRDGTGILAQQRMYQLVRQHGPIVDRVFAIEFMDRGAEAFAFTFG